LITPRSDNLRIARVAASGEIGYVAVEGDEVAFIDGPPIGNFSFTGLRLPLQQVRLLAPVLPSKIVCVGKNYAAHAAEFGTEVPSAPLLFLKPSTSIIGPGDSIKYPAGLERLDFEAELAIVIGAVATGVDESEAASRIMGYTCANDVSARDYQFGDGQWTRGKGFDTFCPLGPWIDTDFDPSSVQVRSRLNGELQQDGNTADMIFKPAFLVSYISKIMTLLPGDVIITGTPEGVGPMKVGDEIEIEVSGLGSITNRVVAA
jgi:2-keto-4-pentenoate hydratase/2-oxohepta-3-ene-1,7-dioic acid hydratase in catechol pathway